MFSPFLFLFNNTHDVNASTVNNRKYSRLRNFRSEYYGILLRGRSYNRKHERFYSICSSGYLELYASLISYDENEPDRY